MCVCERLCVWIIFCFVEKNRSSEGMVARMAFSCCVRMHLCVMCVRYTNESGTRSPNRKNTRTRIKKVQYASYRSTRVGSLNRLLFQIIEMKECALAQGVNLFNFIRLKYKMQCTCACVLLAFGHLNFHHLWFFIRIGNACVSMFSIMCVSVYALARVSTWVA